MRGLSAAGHRRRPALRSVHGERLVAERLGRPAPLGRGRAAHPVGPRRARRSPQTRSRPPSDVPARRRDGRTPLRLADLDPDPAPRRRHALGDLLADLRRERARGRAGGVGHLDLRAALLGRELAERERLGRPAYLEVAPPAAAVPHYISLMRWTTQGVAGLPAWRDRVEEGQRVIETAGGTLIGVYVTLGRYDVVEIFEAPDDGTAAEIVMKLERHGAEQTETLRAFTREEAEEIIRRL